MTFIFAFIRKEITYFFFVLIKLLFKRSTSDCFADNMYFSVRKSYGNTSSVMNFYSFSASFFFCCEIFMKIVLGSIFWGTNLMRPFYIFYLHVYLSHHLFYVFQNCCKIFSFIPCFIIFI